jgi:cyclase
MSAPTHHHDGGDLPPATSNEVAEGVFAYVQPDGSWWINNTGFVVGGDHVCAIDASSTERRTRSFLEAIGSVTASPVRTLLNTHHHGDHTNGNCLFGDAVIVGHTNCRSNMADQRIGGLEVVFGDVAWGDLTVVPPSVTFDDRLTLYVGDVRVELIYVGTAAHTTGDVVAWLPDQGVLFAGDLVFNGGTPFVLMGSVAGSLEALGVLRSLGAATIVPGHGGVCGPEQLFVVEGYLQWLQGVARDAKASGVTPLDAARATDLGQYAEWLDPERIVGNLHRAYMELPGAGAGSERVGVGSEGVGGALASPERGAPADVLAAFGDMIAYNGSRPLTCYA